MNNIRKISTEQKAFKSGIKILAESLCKQTEDAERFSDCMKSAGCNEFVCILKNGVTMNFHYSELTRLLTKS